MVSGFCSKRWELTARKFPKHREGLGSQKEGEVSRRWLAEQTHILFLDSSSSLEITGKPSFPQHQQP